MMKKSLIKKIAMIGAVVVGMLAFGGTTQASAAMQPSFDSHTITYHIDSTSKHYKGIWKDAFNEWNSKGVLKFKATSKKKAMIRTTTRDHLSLGLWDVGINNDKGYIKLSRSFLDNGEFSREQRVNVATSTIEVLLGLYNLGNNKRSHLSSVYTPITSYDVAQVKKLYANVK